MQVQELYGSHAASDPNAINYAFNGKKSSRRRVVPQEALQTLDPDLDALAKARKQGQYGSTLDYKDSSRNNLMQSVSTDSRGAGISLTRAEALGKAFSPELNYISAERINKKSQKSSPFRSSTSAAG